MPKQLQNGASGWRRWSGLYRFNEGIPDGEAVSWVYFSKWIRERQAGRTEILTHFWI